MKFWVEKTQGRRAGVGEWEIEAKRRFRGSGKGRMVIQ
jgi:hypothetical protein